MWKLVFIVPSCTEGQFSLLSLTKFTFPLFAPLEISTNLDAMQCIFSLSPRHLLSMCPEFYSNPLPSNNWAPGTNTELAREAVEMAREAAVCFYLSPKRFKLFRLHFRTRIDILGGQYFTIQGPVLHLEPVFQNVGPVIVLNINSIICYVMIHT